MQTWFSYVEHRKTQTMFTLCVQMPFQNSFCCGQASCPYCSDATHNINWSDSAPLKKVEQSDFEIHFAKCEQHEMVQGSMEIKFSSKSFKILFLELSNQNHFFFCHFGYPWHCLYLFFFAVNAILHISRLLKLSRFNHVDTSFRNIPQVEWTGRCKASIFWNKSYPQIVYIALALLCSVDQNRGELGRQ